jgi:hypothetical protein
MKPLGIPITTLDRPRSLLLNAQALHLCRHTFCVDLKPEAFLLADLTLDLTRQLLWCGLVIEDRRLQFETVCRMSADQFATAFKGNAANAIDAFVQGLGRIQDSGGNLFGVLADLDINEIRLRDTTLRLASAKTRLAQDLDISRTAWEKNTALTDEAGKRYETTASQLQVFQNKLADTQITLGTALLPVLLKVLEASQPLLALIKNMADGFAALDPQAQMVIAGMTALSAVFYPAVIALGSFTTAVKTLIPVVTLLWGLLAAHPFVVIGAAVAALAVAVVMNWDKIVKVMEGWASTVAAKVDAGLKAVVHVFTSANTAITGIARDLAIRVEDYLVGKMLAIFNRLKGGIEEVKGYFKGLYEAVVGHSYIPDMVEEIGDHMRNLDVTMTAPARNAVVNTGTVFQTGVMTWGSTISQFGTTVNQTWGSISSTLAGNLAKMTDDTVNWGEVMKQMGLQIMTSMITLVIGLATQWAIGEAMRTTATVSGNAARVASNELANAAMLTSNTASATASTSIWGGAADGISGYFGMIGSGFASVAGSLIETVTAIGTFIMTVLSAIAEALTATVFGIPFAGAILVGIGLIAAALAMTDNLPKFAAGGIVTGPTVGLMGEAGSAEAAIPLNDRGARFMQNAFGMGSSGTIQNNIYIDGKLMTKAVAKHLHGVINTKLGTL